jgi:hypothetical protein
MQTQKRTFGSSLTVEQFQSMNIKKVIVRYPLAGKPRIPQTGIIEGKVYDVTKKAHDTHCGCFVYVVSENGHTHCIDKNYIEIMPSVDHTHMYKDTSLNRNGIMGLVRLFGDMPFSEDEIRDAVRIEVWHSKFTNPAEKDYSTYELYDIDSNLIAYQRKEGY